VLAKEAVTVTIGRHYSKKQHAMRGELLKD